MNTGISRASGGGAAAREVFAAAQQHGFDGVQAKPSQYAENGLDAEAFRKQYGDLAGLVKAGLVVYPGDAFEQWPEKFGDVISFAGAVGAGHLCICCGAGRDGDTDARTRVAADALSEVGRAAAQGGLSISIHNHANSIFETEEDLERVLGLVDTDVCGLTLDTAHAIKGGITDLAAAARRFSTSLRNVHLKDIDADGTFCPIGTGTAALAPVVETLADLNYAHWLIVDEESMSHTTDDAFRISSEYLSSLRIPTTTR